MRKIIWPITLCLALMMVVSCASIDCPLNNMVYAKFKLHSKLADTLTISTMRSDGSDSVLLNKSINTDSFQLPMSYKYTEDVLFFERKGLSTTTIDTVKIAKTNQPHFESVDCNASIFHTITGVNYTHHAIDSIAITHTTVSYDASKAHFLIYFKSSTD